MSNKPKNLILREYGVARDIALTQDDARRLATLRPVVEIGPSTVGDGYDVTASSYIGVVTTPEVAIYIRPKVPVHRVAYLLSFALGSLKFEDEHVSFETATDIHELIALLFVREAAVVLKRGPLRGYVRVDDEVSTVRGRIDFARQFTRGGIPIPLAVNYDEFTIDIELNRMLKAAVRKLLHLSFRSDAIPRQLRHFQTLLVDVSDVEYSRRNLPRTVFDRLTRHYSASIELATLIIKSMDIDIASGHARATGFVVDMNDVFELFVRNSLRQVLGVAEQDFPAGAAGRRLYLDAERRLRLEPDLSLWDGAECAFVGDVKYKLLLADAARHDDAYQIVAYMNASRCRQGLLVYAGEDREVMHTVPGLGRVIAAGVNLAASTPALITRVHQLASLVVESAINNRSARQIA